MMSRTGIARRAAATTSLIGTLLFAAGVSIALVAPLASCGGGASIDKDTNSPYQGPEISIDSAGPQHIILVQAPSAGWTVVFDQTRPALGTTEVFVSLIRPNPAFQHAQAVVEQRLGSTVASNSRINVFARVCDHGADPKDFAYRSAGRAAREP